jgi:HEAT repeat protein
LPGGASRDNRKLDQKTRLRLTALQALSESGNDKEAFATLKEVALDKSQPDIMRITAIESLEGFRKFDVLPVLVDIARTDPNDDIQVSAIYTIADAGGDKNKTVDALVTLFQSYPKEKEKQQQTALYAIADIGNDKAVDFLVKVATTNENYELRNDAVYYLGNIGSEKSRAALLQILRTK